MRSVLILFSSIAAVTPALATDAPYTCSSFVTDYVLVSGTSPDQKPNPSPGFTKAASVVLGIFMGATRQVLDDQNEDSLAKFERTVIGECSANPKAKVEEIAVAASVSLKPAEHAVIAKGDYMAISLTDLKLDKATLIGKKVEVAGFLQTMGDISMISDGLFDMNKLFVETEKLSRENRKFLLENCSSGCQVTVRGTVSSVMMNEGIVADSIEE